MSFGMITTHPKDVPSHTVTAKPKTLATYTITNAKITVQIEKLERFYKEMMITIKHRTKTQLKMLIENVWSFRKDNLTLPLMAVSDYHRMHK
jgi:hypothetical protein